VPSGYWLVGALKHEDIRKHGSGNIGATNVWRTYGRWYGVPTVLLDTAKGFVPALVFSLTVSPLAGVLAGAGAMLGHARPLFLKFEKGGKMVATCGGVFFGVAAWVAFTALAVWVVVFLGSRYASVASIAAALTLPVAAAIYGYPMSVIVFGALAAAAVVFLHRANLRRLRAGTENRFQLRRTARA
jgi:acyl phosphate:glycerol-3-phosphate acyltransferase